MGGGQELTFPCAPPPRPNYFKAALPIVSIYGKYLQECHKETEHSAFCSCPMQLRKAAYASQLPI
jgi:hypothetical protein